ncbi:MAG: UDP-N-acetylglucosamine 2-epimerase (non-hydrolyzing) [Candidatus Neomarinimicrobiota bacterium]
MKVLHVVGARPNFMKVAPVMRALANASGLFDQALVHTGQHYDFEMSQVFFRDLVLPKPDHYLGTGSGTHAQQTARVMAAFEPVLQELAPDLVLVVGDVNSTLGCALVCAKLGVAVAHVEAGLRSGDRSMPEEINRLLTDQIAELHFTPTRSDGDNLQREGISPEKIHFVGNVMIDSLVEHAAAAARRDVRALLGLRPDRPYLLATFHRPPNVDVPATLEDILTALAQLANRTLVVVVLHPRTRRRITEFGFEAILDGTPDLVALDSQGYLDFLALMTGARVVITDSGGMQEETTYLGLPCLTLRPNTERPITVQQGTNRLIGATRAEIVAAVEECLRADPSPHLVPEYWDGQAAGRIAEVLAGHDKS